MNIVVLDGYTINPGDLSWDPLAALGTLMVYDRTDLKDVVDRAGEAHIVLTNKAVLGASQIQSLPDLQFISVLATGYNIVDLDAAQDRKIVVSNVKGYSTPSVAQHTLALILELANNVGPHSRHAKENGWCQSPDWSYWNRPLLELAGKKLGIIGYGAIGKKVAQLANALDMQVLVYHPRLQSSDKEWVQLVSLDELFGQSDFITLHVPLNAETEHLIHGGRLRQMKASAFLINTSRGQLIHEQDLYVALKEGQIAGAALDVLSQEPPPCDHPLLGLSNCLITPHQAWASFESRRRLMDETVKNVRAFLEGTPRNVITP